MEDRTIAQAVSIPRPRVQSRVASCEIRVGLSGSGFLRPSPADQHPSITPHSSIIASEVCDDDDDYDDDDKNRSNALCLRAELAKKLSTLAHDDDDDVDDNNNNNNESNALCLRTELVNKLNPCT
jgi:hypothetical protein